MTAEDTYKTIAEPSEGIYTEKRSKFIAIALPVRTLDEIKAHLETYQKKYYDARHVCYAYMLGAARKDFRANDNGEPSGTAGKPILGQINSNELTDILIIVVRYFGGIKLGAGGLTRTYAKAVSEAIKAAGLSRMVPMGDYAFTWPIDDVGRVLNHLYGKALFSVKDVQYDAQATIILTCKRTDRGDVTHFLTESLRSAVTLEERCLFEGEEPLEASHS